MSELEQRPEIKKSPPLERQKSKDLHVGFLGLPEKEDEKKKYLTAKFQRNEMSLIRKRLEVESWITDKLGELYDSPEVEIDLEQVLKIEKEEDQRQHLKERLKQETDKVQEIDNFIGSLLEKLKTVK